ncbi:hypothetical protein Tco_1511188 [Tanacetum coccineum]
MIFLLDSTSVFAKANAEGEKWETGEHPSVHELPSIKQAPLVTENTDQASSVSEPAQTTSSALVVHTPEEKASEDKASEKEPPSKRLKFLIPNLITNSPELNLASKHDYRLANLKAEREKSEKKLKKLSLADIQAQAQKLAKFEAKRKKLLDEYNHYITYRADKLLITKIIYKIDRVTKDATMRIERNKQPLSLTVHENFKLKQLGFNEWIEIHALASKTQAEKLDIHPPSELTAFGLSAAEKKRKRSLEIIHEVFVKDNIVVDGMQRNLVPPRGVEGARGLVIKDLNQGSSSTMTLERHSGGSPEAEEMFAKLELTIKARNDVTEARKVVKGNLDVLGQHMS